MNGNEFSRLSYKELQALALRYRVPGNIKKKLLVKVLQAAKGGNENEVDRLLQDLKQNRKKRVRKLKAGKLGITSTPLHSPNYVMADDYYCPQQQPPYQWVAAEEEIVSRDEDGKIPHYEEFKQFLLRKIQKEFHTYDTNNNQVQEPTIVDLRTVAVSSNMPTIPVDTGEYTRSNIVAVNNSEPYVYHLNERVEYQTVEDLNANSQGSILLKKMLQAPLGANLGEIASPVFGGYRLWPMEQYQSTNLLDNSDTLTAESDTQDNEGNLDNNTECYGLLGDMKGQYYLQEPAFVKNVEEIGQQISNVLNSDNHNQYKYSCSNIDTRQGYENWTITNTVEATDAHCDPSDAQASKIFQTMYYENPTADNLSKLPDDSQSCQYHLMQNVNSYSSTQNLFSLNPTEEAQYYDTNMITSVPSDSSNTYYLQNLTKYNGESTGEYFNNIHSIPSSNAEQDAYPSGISQEISSSNNYNSTLLYEYPYTSQANNMTVSESYDQQQQQQQQTSETTITRHEINPTKETSREKLQPYNAVLSPFWPKWYYKNSELILENILNFHTTKRIDLSRLEQTSCVYCYMAPITTPVTVSSGSACSQKEKFVAEYRRHSFTPYWLLYNDNLREMRKPITDQNKIGESTFEETHSVYTSNNNNLEGRLSGKESEESINVPWPNNYANYEAEIEENIVSCDDINVETSDCLLPVITADRLNSTLDPLTMSEAQ